MKIAQVIPCLGGKSGGPSHSVYELTKGLRQLGTETVILTTDYLSNPNIANDDWIICNREKKGRFFEYNPGLKKIIMDSDFDLYHIHSVYTYPVTIAPFVLNKKKKPYIISPRGSLYDSALRNSGFVLKSVFNSDVLTSGCVKNSSLGSHSTIVPVVSLLIPISAGLIFPPSWL